jgi:beta-lactamase class A
MKNGFLIYTLLTSVIAFCPRTFDATSVPKNELHKGLEDLPRGFNGQVGICIQDESGKVCVNGEKPFPLQSVMKLLVGLAVMEAVDFRGWHLDDAILVRREDLRLYVQPIAKLVGDRGFCTTVGDLVRRSIVDSDSAATDVLVAKLGGPKEVQAFLDRHSISGVRFDRDERHLQTEIVGLEWRSEFVDPALLNAAIASVPAEQREISYRKYQTDPRDTATPSGMASPLFRFAEGKLLSPSSTTYFNGCFESDGYVP